MINKSVVEEWNINVFNKETIINTDKPGNINELALVKSTFVVLPIIAMHINKIVVVANAIVTEPAV